MSYSAPAPYGPRSHVTSTLDYDLTSATLPVLFYWSLASGAWPTQYRAIYVPILVPTPRIVRKLGIGNGGTASGNFDLGLYDALGTRLVSSGSTAQTGTTTHQVVDVTDTTIGPGAYYLAAAMDGTTGTAMRVSATAPSASASGVLTEVLGSVVLPATASWAVDSSLTYYPLLFASFTTVL